jgi:hypothetical protein
MSDDEEGNASLTIPLIADRFPVFTSGRALKITRVHVALVPESGITYDENDLIILTLTPPTGASQVLTLKVQPNRTGGLPVDVINLPAPVPVAVVKRDDPPPKPWRLEMTHVSANLARTVTIGGVDIDRMDPRKVTDVAILFAYTV